MKKFTKIALAVLPTVTVAAPMIAMTSCNKGSVVTMSYDDAKEWVRTTWGENEGKDIFPTTAESTWDFDGEITLRKTQAETKEVIDTYQGYWRNHFTNTIGKLGYITTQATISNIAKTYVYEENSLTFSVKNGESAFTSDTTMDASNFYKTLTSANFDEIINCYFSGTYGKKYAKFIVDTKAKTLIVSGVFSSAIYDAANNGWHILTLPDCSISFGSKGEMTGVKFEFGKYCEAQYIWYSTVKASYTDWFDFTVSDGGKITVKYNYAA